jgi:DNA-binding Lrp family transcriptional regulator
MAKILAKNSKETMLKDEIQVLGVLEQHAKESVDEIAKRCGFSRQKVWKIIKNLEENKTIWGYSAIADGTLRDLKHFVLLVKRNTTPFDESFKKEVIFEKIDDNIPESVKIENIYVTNGNYDLVFTFYAPNLSSAKNFINTGFSTYSKYVREYLLLETLIPIRKRGLKNPKIKELIEYL